MMLYLACIFRLPCRAALPALVCLFLAGCAPSVPVPATPVLLPTPLMRQVTEWRPGEAADHCVLVVQTENQGTRWSLFDALGVPRARQILQDGQWRNDGFLPPDRAARMLFAALIFAWTPPAELAVRYGEPNVRVHDSARVLIADGLPIVTVTFATQGKLQFVLGDGTRWQVAPLEDNP